MGSWADLRVGDTTVTSYKSDVPPEVWMMFTRDDLTTRLVADDERAEPREVVEFVIPVRLMLDRLSALGIGAESVREAFDELIKAELERERSYAEDPRMPRADPDPVAVLDGMTLTTWRTRLLSASTRVT